MSDWPRLINTTTQDYLRDGGEVNILRNRKITALMLQNNRVVTNQSGTKVEWKVKYKRAGMVGFADGDTVTFARRDRYLTAELPWRGYMATDMMTEIERLKNRGVPAIIENYQKVIPDLLEDVEEAFADEFYVDGNASGNSKRLHGIESFFGTAVTPDLNNGFADPSDTYAGLSTVKQNYGGNWTGTWPNGKGDAHYDCFSPIIVNYTDAQSGVYTSTTKTWPNTCLEALRKGIRGSRRSKSKKGMLDLILVEEEMYEQLKNALESKQQLQIVPGQSIGLTSFGYSDVIVYDGVEISSEWGMTSGVGYGFNTQQMELRSLQERVFMPDGPVWDSSSQSWRFQVTFYGNLRFNPKFFVKFGAYG